MKLPRSLQRAEGGDRAVSELLGAILIFALLALLLVLAQVTLVPALNQQVEFEHSQRVGDDFGDLGASSSRVASTGISEQTNLELGVNYPNRPLLINPGPVQGVVEAQSLVGGLAIDNLSVPSNSETDEYWDGDDGPNILGVYDTSVLTYEAQYNEFGNSGRVYVEGGIASFTRYPTDDIDEGGSLVDGRRINLVVFGGDFQRITDGSATVELTPVSGPTRTLSVTDSGTPITITLQTFLEEEKWQARLSGEPLASIKSYTGSGSPDTPNTLVIELAQGETYELRMAQVGVGTGVDRAAPAYLTREPGSPSVVPTNGGQIAVDVRDAFNNPVAGGTVTFAITDGTGTLAANGTTGQTVDTDSGADGRATAVLSGTDGTVEITATIETGDATGTQAHEEVTFDVQVGDGDDGPSDPNDPGDGEPRKDINPNTDGVLVLEDTTTDNCQPNSDCAVRIDFDNKVIDGANQAVDVTIDSIRINTYVPNGPGASGEDTPDYAVLLDGSTTTGPELAVGDIDRSVSSVDAALVTVPASASPTNPYTLTLRFFQEGMPTDNEFAVPGGDNIVLTLTYSYDDDGDPATDPVTVRSTYILSPLAP